MNSSCDEGLSFSSVVAFLFSSFDYLYWKNENSNSLTYRLNFYEQVCLKICPTSSKAKIVLFVDSKLDLFKLVVTIVCTAMYMTSPSLVEKFWVINAFFGFVIGGFLWLVSFLLVVKNAPAILQMPSYNNLKISLIALSFISVAISEITDYYEALITSMILSFIFFFLIGVILSYWYGVASDKSLDIIILLFRVASLSGIYIAQSDCWIAAIIVILVIVGTTIFTLLKVAIYVSKPR